MKTRWLILSAVAWLLMGCFEPTTGALTNPLPTVASVGAGIETQEWPGEPDREPATPFAVERCTVKVTAEALHLRTEPNVQAPVLAWLVKGEPVLVLAQEGEWWMVQAHGIGGYVNSHFLGGCE